MIELRRGDRVRVVVPSNVRGRIRKMRNREATVVNVVDNSLNEYSYPVVIDVDGYGRIAVKPGEVGDTRRVTKTEGAGGAF